MKIVQLFCFVNYFFSSSHFGVNTIFNNANFCVVKIDGIYFKSANRMDFFVIKKMEALYFHLKLESVLFKGDLKSLYFCYILRIEIHRFN